MIGIDHRRKVQREFPDRYKTREIRANSIIKALARLEYVLDCELVSENIAKADHKFL